MGGSDELTNLELLHPNCHRQLHSNESRCSPKTLIRLERGVRETRTLHP